LSIEDGIATGSGRSIKGFDLHGALTHFSHLFEKFGGHKQAVGLTLKVTHIDTLIRGFEEFARETLNKADLIPTIHVDTELTLSELDLKTVRQIALLAPFGPGNPVPLFYAHSLEAIDSGVVGERHLKLKIRQGNRIQDAIGFGLADRYPLEGNVIHMVFSPEINEWKGYEKIQLRVIDVEVMKEGSLKLAP
jgi:single-stranded-DNA-specific exonuclease